MAIVTRRTVKEFLSISVDTYNDLIDMFIIMVEADYETIRNKNFDIDSNDDLEYDDSAELIASHMIGYLLKTSPLSSGIYSNKKSESIGGYSYTRGGKDDMINGYPRSIVGSIKRYCDLK